MYYVLNSSTEYITHTKAIIVEWTLIYELNSLYELYLNVCRCFVTK